MHAGITVKAMTDLMVIVLLVVFMSCHSVSMMCIIFDVQKSYNLLRRPHLHLNTLICLQIVKSWPGVVILLTVSYIWYSVVIFAANYVCAVVNQALHWRHDGRDSVSNLQPYDCLLIRLFRRRSRKHQSSASLAFVWEIHRGPVNSPHKWPVTRKMFRFDDVIMPKPVAPHRDWPCQDYLQITWDRSSWRGHIFP